MVAVALRLWFGRKHGWPLALHVFGLALLVFWISIEELEEGEASLLSPCALVRHVEHLQSGAEILVDGEILLHLDIADAIDERGNDGFIRHLGNLEVNIVEALDVFLRGLSRLLLDAAQVTRGRRAVTSALEVGDEAATHLVPGGDRSHGQVQEPGACAVLEGHGELVRHDFLIATGHLDA